MKNGASWRIKRVLISISSDAQSFSVTVGQYNQFLREKMPKEDMDFIKKLYSIIQNHNDQIVEWDRLGKGFVVNNLLDFTNQILLRKFSISRLDSFARKLNKYGFKRSKIEKNRIRFFHPYFNKEGNCLYKIQKLNKEDTLPKHIKLRLIRDQLSKESMSDQQIACYLTKCEQNSDEQVRKFQVVNGNYVLVPYDSAQNTGVTSPLFAASSIEVKMSSLEKYLEQPDKLF